MDDLCTACLCSDRNLYYIGTTEYYHIYSQILNEIPVYDLSQICIRICWECRATLRRFQTFKDQVKSCYAELLQYIHHGQQDAKLSLSIPRLQTSQVSSISYPEIKDELDILDEAYEDHHSNFSEPLPQLDNEPSEVTEPKTLVKEEDHNDLKTFANDLNLKKKSDKKKKCNEVEKVKPTKEKKKRTKIKKPSKLKKKKRKLKETKIKSNSDSCQEFNDLPSCEDDEICKKEEIDKEDAMKDKFQHLDSKACDNIYDKNQEDYDIDINITNQKEPITEIADSISQFVTASENQCLTVHSTRITRVSKQTDNGNLYVPVNKAKITKTPKEKSSNDKPQCNECGKVFSSRKTLRYHLNVLHKGNNRYPCPRCGKVYQWKSNLGRHLRSHKARDTGELYCETCDKRFASVATYRQHLSISKQHVSESEFSFSCDDCGKKFVNKTRLRDHIDWEHLQKIKFRCQLCNKPFKCHTSLYVHIKNVHRNKGLKDNLCHVCGKSYQNAAKLRYHIVAMHTTETPYQCEQCSVAFGWYSSLYRHVREVHHKVKLHPSKTKRTKKRPEPLPPLMQPYAIPMPQPEMPL